MLPYLKKILCGFYNGLNKYHKRVLNHNSTVINKDMTAILCIFLNVVYQQ